MKSFSDEDGFIKITISPSAYEMESLNDELKRVNTDKGLCTEANNPFKIKANFSTLGPIIEISPQGSIISFMFDDSMRDLLGLNARTLYEIYN